MRSQADYDALERRNARLTARVGAEKSAASNCNARPFDPERDLTPYARPSRTSGDGFSATAKLDPVNGPRVVVHPPHVTGPHILHIITPHEARKWAGELYKIADQAEDLDDEGRR